MKEWLAPGLLLLYKQANSEFRCNTANMPLSFLLAPAKSPEKALTPANYTYICVDSVNMCLFVSDYYSCSYKLHTEECGLYFPFDIPKYMANSSKKEENIKLSPPKKNQNTSKLPAF